MKKIASLSFVWLLAIACNNKQDTPAPANPTLEVKVVKNLYAPNDVVDRQTGQVIEERPFVKFSFAKGTVVEADESWDIAFKGTAIIVNGGASTLDNVLRNGNAAAYMVDDVFEQIRQVPIEAVWRQDSNENYAIPRGAGNGWYNYNFQTHLISPIPGRILLFRDAQASGYAKLEILSYYKDAPANPNPMQDTSAYYTFRYVYQPNGTQFD